jgi:hypothetical protein
MTILRSGKSYEQSRPITEFPSFSRLPPEIRDMIWSMALPSKRYIVSKTFSNRLHHRPTLLYVNSEARTFALKHYTELWKNNGIRELYVDFRVDAFHHETVDLSRAFYRINHGTSVNKRLAGVFQTDIRNRVCTIVFDLGELKPRYFEEQLCRTGFCKGLLPSLREMIFYVRDERPSAAKLKLRKHKLRENKFLEAKPFCNIKASFDKWVRECQHCVKHNQERSSINKALQLTFATGSKVPSELVPIQDYTDRKYIPVEWFS